MKEKGVAIFLAVVLILFLMPQISKNSG